MATKLTCDFCKQVIPEAAVNAPIGQTKKCTVSVYRDRPDPGCGREMLDRDACSTCADMVARILARADGDLLRHFLNLSGVR